MKFRLLDNKFLLYRSEKLAKTIYVDGFVFSANCTSTNAIFITRQFGKCAVSQSSAKIISSIQSKRFTCSYSKKILYTYFILFHQIFDKYLKPRKEITRFVWSKQQQKSWTDVTIDH